MSFPVSNFKRQVPGKDPVKVKTMSDERLPFAEERVRIEAARCLECGAARVDSNICIGCGLCTVQCKFDAIHLTRDYAAFGADYEHLVPAIVQEMGRKTLGGVANIGQKILDGREGYENLRESAYT